MLAGSNESFDHIVQFLTMSVSGTAILFLFGVAIFFKDIKDLPRNAYLIVTWLLTATMALRTAEVLHNASEFSRTDQLWTVGLFSSMLTLAVIGTIRRREDQSKRKSQMQSPNE